MTSFKIRVYKDGRRALWFFKGKKKADVILTDKEIALLGKTISDYLYKIQQ